MTVEPNHESWKWDETLFAGAAEFYERGRLPYAPGIADALRDALGLDGRGRLIDCGCGPGTVTLRLAHLFEDVIGLDPDPGMLAEAQRAATERGVTNARWLQMRAEELPGDVGRIRVATFAASFHWMDRLLVARAVRTMLEPGGAAVQVDAPGYRAEDREAGEDLPYPLPPEAEIVALRVAYLGPDRRAGQGVRNSSLGNETAVFEEAGFPPAETVVVPDGRIVVRTEDEMVAYVFSSSPTAPHLFGPRLPDFERDPRALLRRISPDGRFAVRLPDNRLSIWRLPG